MPEKDEVSSLSQGLILLDKKALLEHKIGLVFPQEVPKNISIRVTRLNIFSSVGEMVQETRFDEIEEDPFLIKNTPGVPTDTILLCLFLVD